MNKLITRNIWGTLSGRARKTKTNSHIAVAYFGKGGAKLLPLRKGSVLLVDASESTVKCGQTCPAELLKLYYKGVNIYSRANLHAKIYVLGNVLYVGSANVSHHSKRTLKEVLYRTTDVQSVKDAREFILSFCHVSLGDGKLKKLQKLYRPPHFKGTKSIKHRTTSSKNTEYPLFTVQLQPYDFNDEEQKHSDKGNAELKSISRKKSLHEVDEFIVEGTCNPKKNDYIVQVDKEGKDYFVSPVGQLIHKHGWYAGDVKKTLCYVELPNKYRKN
ncbi:MAG: hypothetical protein K8I03_11655, partial [Ignavibacteria bacterium]|nr:hypothetical protein [Ignavibacteria bacterium]